MRIAILDADPRICGPMVWMRHLMAGFSELGHEVAVVSSTKSGRARSSWGEAKWGGHWSVYAPSIVVRDDDLGETLSGFDLIVLPEPKVPAIDKEAMKNETTPVYLSALYGSGKPFIFALHGNDYDEKSAPFLNSLVAAPNFCRRIISHSQRSTVTVNPDILYHYPVIDSALPYHPQRSVNAQREYTATVGTTGRFMFNKGVHVVGLAASLLEPPGVTVELWGSDSTGLGASRSFALYEGLLDNAEKYARYGDQEEKKDDPKVTEHGNIIRPYLWDIRLSSGQLVRYLGNYTDPVRVCDRLAVHVNLTGFKYSGGLVEYSTLEALDSGAICITPNHVSDDRFQTLRIDVENPPGGIATAKKSTQLLEDLAKNINGALAFAMNGDPTVRQASIEHNREAIREVNSAKKVAKTFLEGAFSGTTFP